MRVLLLHHDAGLGGAETSFRLLARGLQNAGVEPIAALPADGPLFRRLREERLRVVRASLRATSRPHRVRDVADTLLYLARTVPAVARLMRRTNADFLHSNTTTSHLVGVWSAALCGRPAVWHCRDLAPLGALAPLLARRTARVIAISNCVAEFLGSQGVPPSKLQTVPNALDLSEWQPGKSSQLRSSLGWPEDSVIFGTVGQMVRWKNLSAFIESAALLKRESRARFVIVGCGPEEVPLRALARERGLEARLAFVRPRADAADVLSAFDCLVHPSESEPFGRVLIEAMALEKAVVAVDKAGPREIITSGRDGWLVPAGTGPDLASAMSLALESEQQRREIGRAARETVRARFRIETQARALHALYRQIYQEVRL